MLALNLFLNIIILIWTLIVVLLLVALTTLMERKVMGLVQFRQGPNLVGVAGLLQPVADGVKLIFKETIIPYRSRRSFFVFAPMLCFTISLMSWVVIPFWWLPIGSIYGTDLSLLLILVFSSVNVYGLIISGWSSTNKYALLGSLRSSAQMLSYEICFTLSLLPLVFTTQSLDLVEIIHQQRLQGSYIFILLPTFLMMYITLLAETNRVPFDLPEAEAELVSGFNTEYSSLIFALFFLAEYSNVILTCALLGLCFFSLSFTCNFIVFIFILSSFLWIRASLPRYRYDQLMAVCWKNLLPLTLGYVFLVSAVLYATHT